MPITSAIKPYRFRSAPNTLPAGVKGFVDVEHANIQRGIRPIGIGTHTAAYTVTAADEVVAMDTTAGPLSVTLPAASGAQFLRVVIINVGSGTLTVVGTVSGAVNPTLAQYKVMEVYCDGTLFLKIGAV